MKGYPYIHGDGAVVAQPLFQGEGGGSIPTSPLQLTFESIDIATAAQFNALWHSRLPSFPVNTARCGDAFVATYDGCVHAVAIWTPPIARLLNGKGWYELRRLAIAPTAPKNTASRMLGWMVRELRRRHPWIVKFISYQDVDAHTGTIYAASGWKRSEGYVSSVQVWTGHRSRPRKVEQGIAARMRWELEASK